MKLTFHTGGKYVGEWKDGEPWNGMESDKDGNITGKYDREKRNNEYNQPHYRP